jgi:hypothetical protein
MAHCSGGNGPNAFGNGTSNGPVIDADHDLVKALERWVEQGTAPSRIVATHLRQQRRGPRRRFPKTALPVPSACGVHGRRFKQRRELRVRDASRTTSICTTSNVQRAYQ